MSLKKACDLYLSKSKKAKSEKDTQDTREVRFAMSYLDKFGYFLKDLADWKDIKLEDVLKAITQFQAMFGLVRNAILDPQTIRAMQVPRCGCPDFVYKGKKSHKAFFAIREFVENRLPAWRKRSLLVHIADFVGGIGRADQQEIIMNAFRAWTAHGMIDVELARPSQVADVVVTTGEGPRSNFDGPGGTLAWANLPNGVDSQLLLVFDLGETWVTGSQARGIIMGNVACHEAGHIFGLDHSQIPSALMAPYYSPNVAVPQINDDIGRFQARYGVRPVNPNQPPSGIGKRTITIECVKDTTKLVVDGKTI